MIYPKKLDKSEKFWNNVSKRFGNPNRTMNSPSLQRIRQNADKYFTPTDKILDIGCGPGDITIEIARKTKEVYATDISQGMIDAAKQKADKHNINNIKFIKTEQLDKRFHPDSFDVIIAFNMLQYMTVKNHLYDNIYEFLKPKGLFISSTACLREKKSAIRLMMAGLTSLNLVPEILFYKTAELESEIKESGFTIIEATDIARLPERFIISRKD